MSYFLKNKGTYLLLLLSIAGCKEPFNPPPIVAKNHFLVVEGTINDGGPTTIMLSRTRNLTDTGLSIPINGVSSPIFELNATVDVEDDHGDRYSLPELGVGQYGGVTLPLNDQYLYRLHIKTSNGEEYLSAFVPVLQTPPIDSISWKVNNSGATIYINTHNDQSTIGYYRWEYKETWEFHVYYQSIYQYDASSQTLIPRTDEVYYCWQSDNSTDILVGSTANLEHDIISSQYLTSIPYHDEKMSVLYSILVKQYAMTQPEYNFWYNTKKNTEELGSLFDPQPSNATGNIHCVTDPKELVIGYVGAGNMTEKRIFIYNSALPSDWNDVWQDCPLIDVSPDSIGYWYGVVGDIPLDTKHGAYPQCADCTTRGTNVKPAFWP